jgi:hypothetical protein
MSAEAASRDRLTELSDSNALLASALAELRGGGISNATADALVGVRVTDGELSEFLDLAARDAPPASVFGLALSLPEYIDRRRAGHDALDYCLSHGNLGENRLEDVAKYMLGVTTPDAVVWCHRRLTTVIRRDNPYYYFLARHLAVVIERCHDEMIAYLLHPNRGPAPTNIDAFDLVIHAVDDPQPFFRRWEEWILDGLFDPGGRPGSSPTSLHYRILTERWGDPAYFPLRDTTHFYVLSLLRSPERERRAAGVHHLVAMIVASYLGADHVVHELLPRVHDVPADEIGRFALMRNALAALAAANAAPTDQELLDAADKLQTEVIFSIEDH